MTDAKLPSRRVVVTGATGFLGGALARRLHAQPETEVIALGRDKLRLDALRAKGIKAISVDLCDRDAVRAAFEAADTVIHSAALSSPWGARKAFERANVLASENVARACVAGNVRHLVHVSTPGIHHDGRPHFGIREDDPLPHRAVNDYADTKRIAEARVRGICMHAGLPVVILRPRAIFGPGDTSLLPRLAQALQAVRLRRLGRDDCLIDMSYIDNVVDAALLAADAPPNLAGRAYGISNGEPVRIWEVIDRLARALGVPPPRGRVPAALAWWLAAACEGVYRVARAGSEPPLLRYAVELLTVDMTLDISRARGELGYRPRVSMEEALDATFAALRSPVDADAHQQVAP